jgi:hypothetical protein
MEIVIAGLIAFLVGLLPGLPGAIREVRYWWADCKSAWKNK